MAFPSDIEIGDTVHFLPRVFDILANAGIIAAIITDIDEAEETVDLTIFPPRQAPQTRRDVGYYADVDPEENAFKKVADTLPACADEVTALSITDTSATNFRLEWVLPSNTAGTNVQYQELGGSAWKSPNQLTHKSGHYESANAFIFTDLDVGQDYVFRIRNVCTDNQQSAGVLIGDAATTPP